MVLMEALKPFEYAKRKLQVGEPFSCRERDVKLLTLLGRAKKKAGSYSAALIDTVPVDRVMEAGQPRERVQDRRPRTDRRTRVGE